MDHETGLYFREFSDILAAKTGRVYLDYNHSRVCVRGPARARDPLVAFTTENIGYAALPLVEIFPFYELRAAPLDMNINFRSIEFDENAAGECRRRVRAMLDTLIDKSVRHVVLDAFGCGIHRNPPGQVARIFREELGQMKDFDVVAFGITDNGGFVPFRDEFVEFLSAPLR